MDKNNVIGFSLIAILLIGYFAWNSHSQQIYSQQKKHIADSIALLHPLPPKPTTPLAAIADYDTTKLKNTALLASAQTLVLENKNIKIQVSTLGAHPIAAQLKGYLTFDKTPLYLFNGIQNKLFWILPERNNTLSTDELLFTQQPSAPGSLHLLAQVADGKNVELNYTLPDSGYMLNCELKLNGINTNTLPLHWEINSLHTEKEVGTERMNNQIYYQYTNKEHDYYTIRKGNETKALNEANIHWVGMRMPYFNTILIAANGLNNTKINANNVLPDSSIVGQSITLADMTLSNNASSFQLFMGPNQYYNLKSYNLGLEELVPMGSGLFSFVKYINRGIVLPIFAFLTKFISNYGIIIMILTLFFKFILSFFTYKSYLSSAKMRVLKPELDELRAKYGDDQQRMGVEQMKMYKSAGVNPLGGCLPTLLQLPIFIALYSFFPSAIEFRQKAFLWAHDLSIYDSILNWKAQIPLLSSVLGNHISLFTVLMTVSSLFLALVNRNLTPQDPNNPMMKYMPYIFPIMLLGVFNKMAACLSFYYFFSNLVTIIQQLVIQKFFIDEKKIHAQIQENRTKPATPSKWQAKLEEIQKAQQAKLKVKK